MSKIKIDQVAEILKKHKLEPAMLREIIEEMNSTVEPEEEGKVKLPTGKKQFVVLANGSTGWVLQIPEGDTPQSVVDKINSAAHDFNSSKKGRLLPVENIGEALESVPRKYMKNADVLVKTKTPIYIIPTNNKLSEASSV